MGLASSWTCPTCFVPAWPTAQLLGQCVENFTHADRTHDCDQDAAWPERGSGRRPERLRSRCLNRSAGDQLAQMPAGRPHRAPRRYGCAEIVHLGSVKGRRSGSVTLSKRSGGRAVGGKPSMTRSRDFRLAMSLFRRCREEKRANAVRNMQSRSGTWHVPGFACHAAW